MSDAETELTALLYAIGLVESRINGTCWHVAELNHELATEWRDVLVQMAAERGWVRTAKG